MEGVWPDKQKFYNISNQFFYGFPSFPLQNHKFLYLNNIKLCVKKLS